jgi:hypothetical protein
MRATAVRRSAILGLFVAQGCIAGRIGQGSGPTAPDWPQTLAQAEAAASERRYADADRLLANFATLHPGTEGAVESAYWRGVLALEPANQDGSPQVAIAFLESYGKSSGALPHRLEADVFRHVAQKLQLLSQQQATVASATTSGTTSAAAPTPPDVKAKDAEIQRLKEELAKANDELERIKRRLTAPTKP